MSVLISRKDADHLTDCRIGQGLTRLDVAAKTHLSERTIWDIENHKRDRFYEATLAAFCEALGCDLKRF